MPAIARPVVWQILLGYLPSNRGRRRQHYKENVMNIVHLCNNIGKLMIHEELKMN